MDMSNIQTMVRATDPVTSVEAAEGALQFTGAHRERILAALQKCGPTTPPEIGLRTRLTVVQVDRRMVELQRAGDAHVLVTDGFDVKRDGFRVWSATSE